MSDTDKNFAGSIPALYDRYLVPLIFEGFAEDMAKRVAAQAPKTVLETAAGSGVVTRALADKLSPDARYVVTDLNQPMLAQAAERQGGDPRITWQQADALDLPFEAASFDAVVCQFGVMFIPDKVAGFKEAGRVLRPDGRLIFNVWDRIEANDFANLITQAAVSVFPDDPPLFLARTPHGYHDVEGIEEDLKLAGFSQISITTLEKVSQAPSPRHPAIAFCQGTPLRGEIEARDSTSLDLVTDRAAETIAQRHGEGAVSGRIRGHVVEASF